MTQQVDDPRQRILENRREQILVAISNGILTRDEGAAELAKLREAARAPTRASGFFGGLAESLAPLSIQNLFGGKLFQRAQDVRDPTGARRAGAGLVRDVLPGRRQPVGPDVAKRESAITAALERIRTAPIGRAATTTTGIVGEAFRPPPIPGLSPVTPDPSIPQLTADPTQGREEELGLVPAEEEVTQEEARRFGEPRFDEASGELIGWWITNPSTGERAFVLRDRPDTGERDILAAQSAQVRAEEAARIRQQRELAARERTGIAERSAAVKAQERDIAAALQLALLKIRSSPGSRIRFEADQARRAGTSTIGFETTNPNLQEFFQSLNIDTGAFDVSGAGVLGAIPQLSQLQGLSSLERETIDAVLEEGFGRRLSGLTRRAGELQLPGGGGVGAITAAFSPR